MSDDKIENRIEFKIVTDSQKNKADLKSMNFEVAMSFKKIIDSLTEIIASSPNPDSLTLRIEEGSVTCAIDGEETGIINEELTEVAKSESVNSGLVKSWRNIQAVFLSNGLEYQAVYYTPIGESIQIMDVIKNNNKIFRAKVVRKPPLNTKVEFITGRLIAVGGKSPNIHVETKGDSTFIVSCERGQTEKAKAFLYKEILLSAWSNNKGYTLCDTFYPTQKEYFIELQKSIEYVNSANDEVDSLKRIHYECKKFLQNERYGVYKKFIRLFNGPNANIGSIKTILLITNPFINKDEGLKYSIEELRNSFAEKMNRLNKKRLNGKEIY